MAERLPIDNLIDVLSQSQEETTSTISGNANAAISNETTAIANDAPSPPSTPPISIRRQVQLAKYLSSSSLKRKMKKRTNCKYCNRFSYSRQQLERHLTNSEVCLAMYKREFKVNKIESVLGKTSKEKSKKSDIVTIDPPTYRTHPN